MTAPAPMGPNQNVFRVLGATPTGLGVFPRHLDVLKYEDVWEATSNIRVYVLEYSSTRVVLATLGSCMRERLARETRRQEVHARGGPAECATPPRWSRTGSVVIKISFSPATRNG